MSSAKWRPFRIGLNVLTLHGSYIGFMQIRTGHTRLIFISEISGWSKHTFRHKNHVENLLTRSFDVSFDLQLNKRLSKQSWGWWLETASGSLWRHWENEWWHRLLTHKRSHLDSVTKCQQTDQYCCILCRLSYYDCQTGSTLWNWREFSHMP